jgi:hypothetical protein
MCHRYCGNTVGGARNVKPRDLRVKTEIRKIVSVGARKLPAGGTPLNVVRSSEISIWKAAGGAEKQMHFPRCLKNPFEEG